MRDDSNEKGNQTCQQLNKGDCLSKGSKSNKNNYKINFL